MGSSDNKVEVTQDGTTAAGPKSISRRSILKGSVKAMPVVLTLHSGAALARSSNLITGTITPDTDELGRTLCLNTASVKDMGDGVYDLGEPPYAEVYTIPARDYRDQPNGGGAVVTEPEICEQAKIGYFKDPDFGWEGGEHNVQISQGMLISGTALTSFASVTTLIEDL